MANVFSNKVSILAELWMNYRDDEQLKDFVEYNDLGFRKNRPFKWLASGRLIMIFSDGVTRVNNNQSKNTTVRWILSYNSHSYLLADDDNAETVKNL